MSGDGTAHPAVPEGWYPDPANPASKRWWDGGRWTNDVDPPVPPVSTFGAGGPLTRGSTTTDLFAATHTIAAATRDTGIAYTRAGWWIAFHPLWCIVPQAVIIFVLDSIAPPQFSLLLMCAVGVNLATGGLLLNLAYSDRRALLAGGNHTAASYVWMFLTPLGYLIARAREVSLYEVGGWSYVIWWLIAAILTPGVAFLAGYAVFGLIVP